MDPKAPEAAIEVRRNASLHRFELLLDGQLAGELDYRDLGDRLDLVHTELDARHEGRGLGGRLVQGALEDARQAGQSIVPSCSFVAAWLRRHPEFAGTVAR